MNSTKIFYPDPNFSFWPFNWVINWCHSNGGWYEHFIHTFEFVTIFTIKIYQYYSREEIDPDQCNFSWSTQISNFMKIHSSCSQVAVYEHTEGRKSRAILTGNPHGSERVWSNDRMSYRRFKPLSIGKTPDKFLRTQGCYRISLNIF